MKCEMSEDCGNEAIRLITSRDSERVKHAPSLNRVPICAEGIEELLEDNSDIKDHFTFEDF